MASSADVREIMGLGPAGGTPEGGGGSMVTKEMILAMDRPRKSGKKEVAPKRPEGMARELYNLLYNDSKDAPPIVPTDSNRGLDQGYKSVKAKLGMRKVRPWKWMPFTNPARKDSLVLYHWRRGQDEGKEYPFAKFNKRLEMPTYTDMEYMNHLESDGWTREETDHLLDLCQRFDLRFPVIHDRYDRQTHKNRSIEDLKERYYGLCEKLEILHADPSKVSKPYVYDGEHERKRKRQLEKLYNRTPEEVEEEEMLKNELRKIEAKKREREKKTQDLQKLIAQADSTSTIKTDKKTQSSPSTPSNKKKSSSSQNKNAGGSKDINSMEAAGIKFPDQKSNPGVALRSQRMKLPPSVGQKKSKAIEQLLQELKVELQPMPTEEICSEFNELRSDLVLLYELKNALATCEVELQTCKMQYESLCPGKTLEIPDKLKPNPTLALIKGEKPRSISDVIDVVGAGATPPMRKRKAALEQSNVLKKIKNKNY
ncbi:hypothetical protein TCAL_12721 [Tigriopus californicus]|uniref:DNA methyltransferase 1-associated protein 1 n=1 Tax=Tigriopus californicus TaxID=6832 RepID=A0A553PSD4_TIGCA|nr:DNA methyltransferase 1-associated protein 1-like [Tigriopus californicus]TRY80581.1 hypothetical protein TCAL_12721 [Tigriopus californicus]